MTLQNFIQLIRENFDNNIGRSDFHIKQDILDTYAAHAENLKNQFFESAERDLGQGKISNLELLALYPFSRPVDQERFQKLIIDIIEKIENADSTDDLSELSNCLWMLLDHMLHDWVISDRDALMAKFRDLKNVLKRIEPRDHSLLQQKLGHFGIT